MAMLRRGINKVLVMTIVKSMHIMSESWVRQVMCPLPVNELGHCIVICVSVSELSMMREIFIVVMTHFTVVG